MKIFAVVTIARQYEGDMISLRFEKAYAEISKAQEYVKQLAKTFTETINVPNMGAIEFFCERGYHEIDVEE